mmetsp:Transcript_415/g.1562  ORF Transcript_415/g.1562 Transcript_415/m.1562 type:complete len:228 (+) Transcript_415:554-1237(+)
MELVEIQGPDGVLVDGEGVHAPLLTQVPDPNRLVAAAGDAQRSSPVQSDAPNVAEVPLQSQLGKHGSLVVPFARPGVPDPQDPVGGPTGQDRTGRVDVASVTRAGVRGAVAVKVPKHATRGSPPRVRGACRRPPPPEAEPARPHRRLQVPQLDLAPQAGGDEGLGLLGRRDPHHVVAVLVQGRHEPVVVLCATVPPLPANLRLGRRVRPPQPHRAVVRAAHEGIVLL